MPPRARRFCTKVCSDRTYRKQNRDRRAAQTKAWIEAHPENRRATQKRYFESNREVILAKSRGRADSRVKYARSIEIHGREKVLETIRTAALKRRFGLTPEEYEALLKSQGSGCAICRMTPEENGRRLAVDHDHACCPDRMKTCGACVRGLLCMKCNNHLGVVENAVWLSAATMYLQVRRP